MPRKGLSREEKRVKIVGVYHATKGVFNLKEMESLAAKQGVVSQSVKEVNQELVDDGLVDCDKIGSGNFFWSFPSKQCRALEASAHETEADIARAEERCERAERMVEELQAARTEGEEREARLARLRELDAAIARTNEQLAVLKENDPEEVMQIQQAAITCRDGANRWTDNVFQVESHLRRKRGMDRKQVRHFLPVPEDFDYVS